jgi:large subunit ribosomal protein L29
VAKKKLEGLKNLSEKEMTQKIGDNRKALFEAKIKLATGQLENTAMIWKLRKEIARVKTFMAQKASK